MCQCFRLLFASIVLLKSCLGDSNIIPNSGQFPVYWNVPTFQCASHKINFTDLARKYEIIQNGFDAFRGDKLAILYDPGAFPAILKEKDSNKQFLRNGGIPQRGNLSLHLELFKETVEHLIEDENFKGLGIIDFESWRPVFRQNFGTLTPYKELSIEDEKKQHPFWPRKLIEKKAARNFELSAQIFMEETLIYAEQLRPNATWGYYAYPYCFNMSPNNKYKECPSEVIKENDRVSEWLFNNLDNLYPSIYMGERVLSSSQKVQMIAGRIEEAQRIVTNGKLGKPSNIYPYFWYKYQDSRNFMNKEDLYDSLKVLRTLNIDGLIIWGSSNDVNSKSNCEELYKYVDFVLGPALLGALK